MTESKKCCGTCKWTDKGRVFMNVDWNFECVCPRPNPGPARMVTHLCDYKDGQHCPTWEKKNND